MSSAVRLAASGWPGRVGSVRDESRRADWGAQQLGSATAAGAACFKGTHVPSAGKCLSSGCLCVGGARPPRPPSSPVSKHGEWARVGDTSSGPVSGRHCLAPANRRDVSMGGRGRPDLGARELISILAAQRPGATWAAIDIYRFGSTRQDCRRTIRARDKHLGGALDLVQLIGPPPRPGPSKWAGRLMVVAMTTRWH